MHYIILDLEWNQSPIKQYENKKIPFEIIEIGAVKLNENREIIDKFSMLIRPQVYKKMHSITEELIHISMKDLQSEKGFQKVVREFLAWCGEEYIFGIWGSQDLTELQRNMEYYAVEALTNGPLAYYDIQKLYSLYYEDGKTRRSLSHAVEMLRLQDDAMGFHRAYSDAFYTGKVFQQMCGTEILKKVSYDTYYLPANREEQIRVHFDTYSKFISRGFDDRVELMEDKDVTCVKCIYCNKALRKKMHWFPANTRHYYCVAHCSEHGYMRGKIRIRRAKDEKIYAVKTVRPMKEIEIADVKKRKIQATEARRKKRIKIKQG
ncbi:MAG: 3'-5' exonuclease [Lachnospiraceae bacterium]